MCEPPVCLRVVSTTVLNIITIIVFTGKYAQVTNNPENDGCINAVLLV